MSYKNMFYGSHTEQTVSYNKLKSKHINSFINTGPKNEQEVIDYFKAKNRSSLEAKKFYNFYETIGWKLNGKNPITNWQACARNWMLKADEIKKDQKFNLPSHNRDNLHTNKDKNYGSLYRLDNQIQNFI